MINHYRDVDIIPLSQEKILVLACDSCGAIGEKELDVVKASPYLVGKSTARVVIMEVLSAGADIVAMTAAICNEGEPTGQGILEGIRDELKEAGIGEIPLTISTEKNMITKQTGLGLTAIGTCERETLRIGQSKMGDYAYAVGIPKVGNEVLEDKGEIADCGTLKQILQIPGVGDIIPVGSQGIAGECRKLVQFLGGHLEKNISLDIDLEGSAGPCTSILFTSPQKINMQGRVDAPYLYIGKIIKGE